jgi:hypothetical protein
MIAAQRQVDLQSPGDLSPTPLSERPTTFEFGLKAEGALDFLAGSKQTPQISDWDLEIP